MRLKSKCKIIVFAISSMMASVSTASQVLIPSPPQVAASSYILMEASTGEIIVEKNADNRLPPASLTKMMTAYIAEKEIAENRISMSDQVPISVKAWKTGGSRMFIQEGTEVSVEDLLKGIVIQSGNDASVAIAEHIAGDESAFVDIMNQQAKLLGMENTHFDSASGLPKDEQYSSARDLAILASHIINDYPENYHLYSEKEFTYANIRQPNRNKLLWIDERVDGLKTGYTEKAKYCLVASGKENNSRFISVVLGANSPEMRIRESRKLLNYAFRYYETYNVKRSGEVLESGKVWKGEENSVDLTLSEDIQITLPKGADKSLELVVKVDEDIIAPIKKGDVLGKASVLKGGEEIFVTDVVAKDDVEKAGFFKSLWHSILLFFSMIF